MDAQRRKSLQEFTQKHQISEVPLDLLNQALTHKSYANELKSKSFSKVDTELHNERLEFLGDAVLGNVIAHALFIKFSNENEGTLTKKKARAVCEPTLAEIASELDLGSVLIVGKGEFATGGQHRKSNIANVIESLIGAIFLGQGFEAAQKVILGWWHPYLEEGRVAKGSIDYKSELQEHLMKVSKVRPDYRVLTTSGPDHNKIYTVALHVKGIKQVEASGSSIKRAEQEAAKKYILKNNIDI